MLIVQPRKLWPREIRRLIHGQEACEAASGFTALPEESPGICLHQQAGLSYTSPCTALSHLAGVYLSYLGHIFFCALVINCA